MRQQGGAKLKESELASSTTARPARVQQDGQRARGRRRSWVCEGEAEHEIVVPHSAYTVVVQVIVAAHNIPCHAARCALVGFHLTRWRQGRRNVGHQPRQLKVQCGIERPWDGSVGRQRGELWLSSSAIN